MLLSETNHLLCSIFSHIHSHLETPSPLPASPLDGKCHEKFPFLLTLPLYLWTWPGGHGSPSVFHSAPSPSSLLLLLGTWWKDIFWFVIDNHAARHLLEGNLFFPDVFLLIWRCFFILVPRCWNRVSTNSLEAWKPNVQRLRSWAYIRKVSWCWWG